MWLDPYTLRLIYLVLALEPDYYRLRAGMKCENDKVLDIAISCQVAFASIAYQVLSSTTATLNVRS